LAIWLSCGENDDVAIIYGHDTEILDHALSYHGLPKIGGAEFSRWRAALQALPMLLSVVWKPVDAHSLAEFLSMPVNPLPSRHAHRLLRALSEEPGVGGRAWRAAIDDIEEDRANYMEDQPPDGHGISGSGRIKRDARDYALWLDRTFAVELYSADEGIPEAKIRELCRWLSGRLAAKMDGSGGDALIKEAIEQAGEVERLSEGRGVISRVALERMLDSVIEGGAAAPDRFPQAARWRTYSSPGGLISPVQNLVWWGFADHGTKPRTYWSDAERAALARSGVEPEPVSAFWQREQASWRRAFLCARGHFLTFRPLKADGCQLPPHPFMDELMTSAPPAGKDESVLVKKGESLNAAKWAMAGRSVSLSPAGRILPEVPAARNSIPAGAVPPPESLSYSGMKDMIACPMKWALRYHSRLRKSSALDLPSGSVMIGNLCHRIAQEIYTNAVSPVPPNVAFAAALRLYDELLPSMASELLLDGREVEKMRYRASVASAIRGLAAAVAGLGMRVVGSEERISSELDGIPFVGAADLILEDSLGNRFVLDLNWSGSDRYMRSEIEEGRALQLAAYAWMLRSGGADGGSVHSGYFMLAQGRLLSDSPLLGERSVAGGAPIEEVWERGARSWRESFRTLNEGILEARGVSEMIEVSLGADEKKLQNSLKARAAENGLIYESPMCGFCDFSALCGARGDSI
ncbi:MAG: PD-(D/E)XK nuclease family protein, partial [Synergistaceae bacterium]|nr:PD-(D/E)XK nuclease family protein [Synergistaceae bacterium]